VFHRRPVLPLQEPGTAAPRPGHERPVDRQPILRAGLVRGVLQAVRVLHHQAEDDEQAAPQDTAVLQKVPSRVVPPPPVEMAAGRRARRAVYSSVLSLSLSSFIHNNIITALRPPSHVIECAQALYSDATIRRHTVLPVCTL